MIIIVVVSTIKTQKAQNALNLIESKSKQRERGRERRENPCLRKNRASFDADLDFLSGFGPAELVRRKNKRERGRGRTGGC